MKRVKELEQLEQELIQMLDNVKRVKSFVKVKELEKWKPYSSSVFGELKHRGVVLKTTITRLSKLPTNDLF